MTVKKVLGLERRSILRGKRRGCWKVEIKLYNFSRLKSPRSATAVLVPRPVVSDAIKKASDIIFYGFAVTDEARGEPSRPPGVQDSLRRAKGQ